MPVGRALVLDPGPATSLAAVRMLGAAGWNVGVGAASRWSLAGASKWCARFHLIPNPRDDLDAFLAAVVQAVEAEGYDIVFGCSDEEVFALSQYRDPIDAIVPYSAHDNVIRAFDKLTLAEIGAASGLHVPKTRLVTSDDLRDLNPPIIVKPRWHWSPESARVGRMRVRVCASLDDALAAAEQFEEKNRAVILQEYHDGPLISFNVLTDKAYEVRLMTQQIAQGLWPIGMGTPTRAVSVEIDPELASGIAAMLRSFEWFGLSNLQFMLAEDGRPYLIDFNGRAYLTMALAMGSGVNFMDCWARLALDLALPEAAHGKVGERFHHLVRDLRRVTALRGVSPVEWAKAAAYAYGAHHIVWHGRDLHPMLRRVYRLAFRKDRLAE